MVKDASGPLQLVQSSDEQFVPTVCFLCRCSDAVLVGGGIAPTRTGTVHRLDETSSNQRAPSVLPPGDREAASLRLKTKAIR
jgi:hypothetical protein